MKKQNIYKIFIATILSITSLQTKAQISQIEIRATGLTCSMCSNAIQKQLKTLAEVDSIETDLNTNTFSIKLKQGNTLTPKIFKEKVEKAGFFVGQMIVSADTEIINKANYILINEKPESKKFFKFQVLDKGFITAKEYKKTAKQLKKIETYAKNNEDDFHIKTL